MKLVKGRTLSGLLDERATRRTTYLDSSRSSSQSARRSPMPTPGA